jgi:uncharacterized protein YnzC (UPF0291/DUF896 family)
MAQGRSYKFRTKLVHVQKSGGASPNRKKRDKTYRQSYIQMIRVKPGKETVIRLNRYD